MVGIIVNVLNISVTIPDGNCRFFFVPATHLIPNPAIKISVLASFVQCISEFRHHNIIISVKRRFALIVSTKRPHETQTVLSFDRSHHSTIGRVAISRACRFH